MRRLLGYQNEREVSTVLCSIIDVSCSLIWLMMMSSDRFSRPAIRCLIDTCRHVKYVRNLLSLRAAGEHCILISAAEEEPPNEDGVPAVKAAGKQYVLILCNAIGSPLDSKYISVQPDYVAMTPFHVAVASSDTLYVWHYRTQIAKLTSVDSNILRRKEGRERVFHVEGAAVDGAITSQDLASSGGAICALAASQRYLLVARESGVVHQYQLPSLALENRFQLRCRPVTMRINCDSTRFSIIDINNMLTFFDMEARAVGAGGSTVIGEHLPFERKDVWDMCWADDYPELWCITEKTRMYVFRGTEPEEPVLSSGYLRRFSDLTISSILLDEIMEKPDAPNKDVHVIEHETRSLRDMRTLLTGNSLRDCLAFVEDNKHPRLWHLLAETALDKLDLPTAEKAFVAAGDYPGIQFVKRLLLLHDKTKQKAEVAAYFQRFDEAEKSYVDMDRKDLAVELRMRIGDWQRVLAHLADHAGDDDIVTLACTRVGDYYADRQQWALAIPYYERAKALDTLLECYYMTERYDSIIDLIDVLPEGSMLLSNLGRKLQSVGMTEAASKSYLKGGDVKAAVDCCVTANHWDRAIELAHQHQLPQVEGLLSRYASRLLEQGKTLAAIELYRKANRDSESAKLLANLGAEASKSRLNPLRAKHFFVLAALEVERHRKRTMDMSGAASSSATATAMMTMGGGRAAASMATAATLDTLMRDDAESHKTASEMAGGKARTLDAAWHGAEAFHFLMLAQRQLYAGAISEAMVTTSCLSSYEDVLDPKDVYSLVALTAYYNQSYGTASRALIRLEHLDTLTAVQQEKYSDVAFAIFTRNRPTDPTQDVTIQCPTGGCSGRVARGDTSCSTCRASFPICVVSGQPIQGGSMFTCSVCRHKAVADLMVNRLSCALCHAAASDGKVIRRDGPR